MALTSRCRAGGGENLSEELVTEDEGTNGSNFEPLSDSCGESDMEGLDLSLFEPQVDTASWCDSRIHAGTLHILVHYCGDFTLTLDMYFDATSKRNGSKKAVRPETTAEIIRNEHAALIDIGSIKTRKLFGFDIPITPDVLTGCYVASKKQKQFPSHLTSNYSACDGNRGWEAIELTDCRILYGDSNRSPRILFLMFGNKKKSLGDKSAALTQRTHRLFRIQGRVEQWCGIGQPPKSGEAFCRSLNPNRHRNRWCSGLNRLSQYRRSIVHCAPYTCRRQSRDET
ncbi:hypothetical protein ALC56_00123 [Trachymyrmex septentrionalis]|uniref:Uncharacterized protein n=1 Tax=Trachymyrmex septentrionalis TaxID=34720 RepID=A0A195G065_9HYME|nr:hypothetical protein ALC56_00123 [Trachymyrmex septentrionalis]